MKKSIKTFVAAALLGSTAIAPFAIAQDAGTGATTTPPAATNGADTMTPAAPAAPEASSGAMGTTAQAPAASATGTYLTQQAENQISVNDFMGKAIYTADNQSIGDINDLLVQEDGGVVAAVVGVGGFLGIGEKNVAIPFDKITITRETGSGDAADAAADGESQAEVVAEAEIRLTTTETAESLKNAPEFMTLEDQADATDATGTMAPTDGTTTSSTDN